MDFYITKKEKIETHAEASRNRIYKKYAMNMTDFEIAILGILFEDKDEAADHQAIVFRKPMWEHEITKMTSRACKLVNMASGLFVDEQNTLRVKSANASGKNYSKKRVAYPKFTLRRDIIAQCLESPYKGAPKKIRKYTYSVEIVHTKEYATALTNGVTVRHHEPTSNAQNRQDVYEAWQQAQNLKKQIKKKPVDEWAEARKKRMIDFPLEIN